MDTNDSNYKHEYRPKVEWKDNLDFGPINTEMDIEKIASEEKTSKGIMDEDGDIEMGETSSRKKAKI